VVAALLMLLVPASQVVALAMTSGSLTAHCCCGDHPIDHECGCPDCPATARAHAKARAARGESAIDHPTLSSCHGRSVFVMTNELQLGQPPVGLPEVSPPRLEVVPLVGALGSRPSDPPPVPPPQG
jgi:hypothetical protein